jgi:UDP-perosamine 4-acetyltransferase
MTNGDSNAVVDPHGAGHARGVGELVILGGGGHAAVVAEMAARAGWRVVGTAAVTGSTLGDPEGAGEAAVRALVAKGARLHAAVGSAEVRERWHARYGAGAFATVVDPSALVSPSARVGPGASIGAGAVVQARAIVGEGAIVNTRAVVEHDCILEPFAHVAPAAVLCGSVRIGHGAQVSAGAVVIPARIVGARATIGAGAVVVRDVPEGAIAVGVPARVR